MISSFSPLPARLNNKPSWSWIHRLLVRLLGRWSKMSWIELVPLCAHLAASARRLERGVGEGGERERAAQQQQRTSHQPRNPEIKANLPRQRNKEYSASRHGGSRGTASRPRALGNRSGWFVDSTGNGWKLRRTENNNTGKKKTGDYTQQWQ